MDDEAAEADVLNDRQQISCPAPSLVLLTIVDPGRDC